MENIMWFKNINKNDVSKVGGKGANLGEMFSHFPIPNGFCITVHAYKQFISFNNLQKKIDKQLENLNIEDSEKLENVSNAIGALIMNGSIPEELSKEIINNYQKLDEWFVAVRSSATAEDLPNYSFAGQQATFLNVKENDKVLWAVKECWASLFTSRAIYYRQINNFEHSKVFISVVIQEMVNSEKAGVMFTVNPINKNQNEAIIEGSFGLGEMVVSGQVTPDNYIVEKNPLKIKNITINEKNRALYRNKDGDNEEVTLDEEKANERVLSDEEIKNLTQFGLKIEKHYGSPQDIEWAFSKSGEIKILQSRAITTL